MPQPLSRVCRDAVGLFIFDCGSAPIDWCPALGAHAAKVIAAWASLESRQNRLLVTMLGAHAKPAVAMYRALLSTSAQYSVFRAAADVLLSPDERDVFEVILKLTNSVAKERHKIAHWIWGYSSAVPDALILCNPTETIESALREDDMEQQRRAMFEELTRLDPAEFEQLRLSGELEARSKELVKTISYDKMFVYKKENFDKIEADIQRISQYYQRFYFILLRSHPANAGDKLFHRLSTEPEIRAELDRLYKRRKRSP